jgi:phenylpropionate dioxygenase-like ring-hydroxylating dioxygenase large terminal subunit
MSSLLNYFGFGVGKTTLPVDTDKKAVRALPASWYISQAMFDLERRAIFSRRWIMITHQVRLKQSGDYLRYDCAGFQFILYRDDFGNVSGIHNICGESELPIVTELKGKLNLAGVSVIYPIHIHVDYNGFIWVNLDGADTPEVPWEEDFGGVDTQERFQGFSMNTDYEFDHEWEMTGDYNWKILADNYNECYHCATTHPDLKEMADLETYSVTPQDGYILHNVRGRPGGAGEEGFKVHPTYYYPSTSMNVS